MSNASRPQWAIEIDDAMDRVEMAEQELFLHRKKLFALLVDHMVDYYLLPRPPRQFEPLSTDREN